MTGYFLIVQSVVIIWLLILLGKTTVGLKRRIDRASHHLEAIDKPREPQAICGCEHHHCFHDENGCEYVREYYGDSQVRRVTCSCKRYTGPEPLPTVIP